LPSSDYGMASKKAERADLVESDPAAGYMTTNNGLQDNRTTLQTAGSMELATLPARRALQLGEASPSERRTGSEEPHNQRSEDRDQRPEGD